MADPNWLFSSTAQSAAAVFAIVGGFIATRVMNLASEREQTQHRLAEVRVTMRFHRDHIQELFRERNRVRLSRALFRVRENLCEFGEVLQFETVFQERESLLLQEDELRQGYEALLQGYAAL